MLEIGLYAKFGLSYCLVGGALLNFASCWIRTIGAYSYTAPTAAIPLDDYVLYPVDAAVASRSFKVQLFGQILAAIGQPLLLNAPPRYIHRYH